MLCNWRRNVRLKGVTGDIFQTQKRQENARLTQYASELGARRKKQEKAGCNAQSFWTRMLPVYIEDEI